MICSIYFLSKINYFKINKHSKNLAKRVEKNRSLVLDDSEFGDSQIRSQKRDDSFNYSNMSPRSLYSKMRKPQVHDRQGDSLNDSCNMENSDSLIETSKILGLDNFYNLKNLDNSEYKDVEMEYDTNKSFRR